jgi:ABC-type amino acid transport substrate-binding protein
VAVTWEFDSGDRLSNLGQYSIAVIQSPSLLRALELALPELEFQQVPSPRDFLRGELSGVDALIMPVEAASAWTLVYPQFTAVVAASQNFSIPVVFALPHDDDDFRTFVNLWVETAQSLGVMDRAYDRWILGRDSIKRSPRWSVIRDVLHWVD